jgi:hypothetical protein
VERPAAGVRLQEQQLPSVHLFPEGGMTNGKGGRMLLCCESILVQCLCYSCSSLFCVPCLLQAERGASNPAQCSAVFNGCAVDSAAWLVSCCHHATISVWCTSLTAWVSEHPVGQLALPRSVRL